MVQIFTLCVVLLCEVMRCFVSGNHFCGATISWKPSLTHFNTVEFTWKSTFTLGRGPCGSGCSESDVGTLGPNYNIMKWKECTSSACDGANLSGAQSYIVTGVHVEQNWEQGENTFQHTFPDLGEYVVGFTGGNWRAKNFGVSTGRWRVQTEVNLGMRSDYGIPNNSPITASKGIYRISFNCEYKMKLGVADLDGDIIRCRWAVGSEECADVCQALPNAQLDEETCTLRITGVNSTNQYVNNGWYAVALTVEDFPPQNITHGGVNKTTADKLSSIPLQFLLATEDFGNCDLPVMIECGFNASESVVLLANETFYGAAYAVAPAGTSVVSINLVAPAGMVKSVLAVEPEKGTYVNLTWTPSTTQSGDNLLCCEAVDSVGRSSETICNSIRANDINECASSPCRNGGQCDNLYNRFECVCLQGFSGVYCENAEGTIGANCTADAYCANVVPNSECDGGTHLCGCQTNHLLVGNDTCIRDWCANITCQNHGNCSNFADHGFCACVPGYGGDQCERVLGIIGGNCSSDESCSNIVESSICTSPSNICGCEHGYYADGNLTCYIDACLNTTCQYNGTCLNYDNSANCSCIEGFSGDLCEQVKGVLAENCSTNTFCSNVVENSACSVATNTCQCVDGYYASGYLTCYIDTCSNLTCLNNGTCFNYGDTGNCSCLPGYTGDICEEAVGYLGTQCSSDEYCSNVVDRSHCDATYNRCECPIGYYEDGNFTCYIDWCRNTPCHNNATCLRQGDSGTCNCSAGFSGTYCEDMDGVINASCTEHVFCSNVVDDSWCNTESGRCECVQGYYDSSNHTCHIDWCFNTTCENGGSCLRYGHSGNCSCRAGFGGEFCEEEQGTIGAVCSQDQFCSNIVNNSHCAPHFNTCMCKAGYYAGDNTTCHTDWCYDVTCQNGGNCSRFGNSGNCSCILGFSGEYCEKVLGSLGANCSQDDFCSNVVGGSHCSNDTNTCSCMTGYEVTSNVTCFRASAQKQDSDSTHIRYLPILGLFALVPLAAGLTTYLRKSNTCRSTSVDSPRVGALDGVDLGNFAYVPSNKWYMTQSASSDNLIIQDIEDCDVT